MLSVPQVLYELPPGVEVGQAAAAAASSTDEDGTESSDTSVPEAAAE